MQPKERWFRLLTLGALIAGLLTSSAMPGLAQADDVAGPPEVEQPLKETMSLGEIVEMGGFLMYVLGGMSILGLGLVLYYFYILRQEHLVPREFVKDIRQMLSAGRLEEARVVAGKRPSAVAAITAAALDYTDRVKQPEPALLKEIIEGEGSRQAALIQNQTQYLLDIAVIAPMIGLLGTVMGMLKAFNAVALDIAKAKPMILAAGVSQALITTAAGLMVGIPAMMAYAYFRGRSSKLLANLETASADLLTQVVRKPES